MQRKLRKMTGMLMLLVCCAVLLMATESAHASTLDDGTYTIDYTIKKPDDESVSMANDYWDKPATLIVSDGVITVQVTVNHSEWVTQFKVQSGSNYVDTKVISRDDSANTRVTQFKVDSVDTPMLSQIHVTVPEIDYDHDYTIRFVFDTNTLKLISEPKAAATPEPTAKATATPNPTEKAAANEQKEADSSSAKPANTAKDNITAGSNEGVTAGTATSGPMATATAADSKVGTADKAHAQSSNQTVDIGSDTVKDSSTATPEQTYEDNNTTDSAQGSDEAVVEELAEENGVTDNEEVELTTALDGAVADDTDSVMSASIAPESNKKNGIIMISFLVVLLVACVITIAIYRKRKSKTGH